MSKRADLHIHTHFSDSTSSPQEVIDQAVACGISCIAITDHDTVDGVQPTMDIGRERDVEVIAGIEFSSEINGRDVHMLGYHIDHTNSELLELLKQMQDARIHRMHRMIDKLQGLGIKDVTFDEVCDLDQEPASIGRPHLAQILLSKGHVTSIKDAFDRYLADDAPAFVANGRYSPYEAIDIIRRFNGIPVLAHPMMTRVDELIPRMVHQGLMGLEVMYPNTTPAIREFYAGLAEKHKLLITGGSDAHGDAKKHTYIGRVTISYDLVEQLRGALYERP